MAKMKVKLKASAATCANSRKRSLLMNALAELENKPEIDVSQRFPSTGTAKMRTFQEQFRTNSDLL
jgi:hypothetical protein